MVFCEPRLIYGDLLKGINWWETAFCGEKFRWNGSYQQAWSLTYLLLCQPIIFAHVFLIIETSKVTPKAFSLLLSFSTALQILSELQSLREWCVTHFSPKNEISSMTNFQAKKSWKDYKLSSAVVPNGKTQPPLRLFSTEIPTKMNGHGSHYMCGCTTRIHFIAYCFTLFYRRKLSLEKCLITFFVVIKSYFVWMDVV